MSLVLQSSGGGQITIQEPATASNFTQTLPAASGTVMVSGNQPAFSAYNSADQSYSGNTNTKVTFNTEEFDTNSNFASNRFTPTVAGYYQLNCRISPQTLAGDAVAQIYKNGSVYKAGSLVATAGRQGGTVVSSLVYANGTTDYFEIYLYVASASTGFGGLHETWFNGSMVRGA